MVKRMVRAIGLPKAEAVVRRTELASAFLAAQSLRYRPQSVLDGYWLLNGVFTDLYERRAPRAGRHMARQ